MTLSFTNQPYGSLVYLYITANYSGISGAASTSFRIWH